MNDDKKVLQTIKFNLPVGEAKPGPVLAPILGQSQINIQVFCKEFIELTQNLQEGVQLPIKIKKFIDKSFKIHINPPTINYIYEQIVMARDAEQDKNNFTFIMPYEVMDIFFILRSFVQRENQPMATDKLQLKLILSFLRSKRVSIRLATK